MAGLEHRREWDAKQAAEGRTAPPASRPLRFTDMRGRGNPDYALRTVQQSLVHFSAMADAKANIMLTVCSLVVTVSITQWPNPALRLPMMVLSGFGLAALCLAIWVVRPSLRRPGEPRSGVSARGPALNLLFFAHFAELSEEEYLDAMDAMLRRENGLYETILRDIHAQGVALARRKYRLLGYSYLVFLAGLGVTAGLLALGSF